MKRKNIYLVLTGLILIGLQFLFSSCSDSLGLDQLKKTPINTNNNEPDWILPDSIYSYFIQDNSYQSNIKDQLYYYPTKRDLNISSACIFQNDSCTIKLRLILTGANDFNIFFSDSSISQNITEYFNSFSLVLDSMTTFLYKEGNDFRIDNFSVDYLSNNLYANLIYINSETQNTITYDTLKTDNVNPLKCSFSMNENDTFRILRFNFNWTINRSPNHFIVYPNSNFFSGVIILYFKKD